MIVHFTYLRCEFSASVVREGPASYLVEEIHIKSIPSDGQVYEIGPDTHEELVDLAIDAYRDQRKPFWQRRGAV